MIYFAHGLALGLLFFAVGTAWAFPLSTLLVGGIFFGIVIGVGVFLAVLGYLNTIVVEGLWFPVRTGFLTCLGHGFLLFVALLPLNLFVVAVQAYVTRAPVVSLLVFVAAAPLNGFLGKAVAAGWRIPRFAVARAGPQETPVPPPPAYGFARK